MMLNSAHFYQPAGLLLAVALLGTVGCSGRPTAQVSGVVKYKDGSLIQAPAQVVRFEPTPDTTAEIRKAASGIIQPDGSFEMYTRKPGDGVIKGKYAVTFSILANPMGGDSLIKDQYTTAATTPYTIEVDKDIRGLEYVVEKK